MTPVINSSLITEIVNVAKELLGLLTEFPLNVFVVASIAGIGFSFLRKAKRVAR